MRKLLKPRPGESYATFLIDSVSDRAFPKEFNLSLPSFWSEEYNVFIDLPVSVKCKCVCAIIISSHLGSE